MSPPQPVLPPGSNDDRGPAYRAFTIFILVLTTLAIVLRFWSRALGARSMSGRSRHRFWWDDWIALLAVFIIWIYFAMAFWLVHLGFGRHIWMVPPPNLPKLFKILYGVYFLFDSSLFLTKLSALLFLTRVFPRHANSTLWNYGLWAAHGLNVAWLLGIILGTVFMCNPVQKGWDPFRPGTCGPTSALWMGSSIPSVFIDLIILILPVPKIWDLKISPSRKAGITLIFLLGYCVIIVSLGRMITVLKSAQALNKDITYEGMPMVYWVTCEAPITIISICLPPMLNLARHFYSSFMSPLGSKISSFRSSRTGGDSTVKSRGDAALNSRGGRSGNDSKVRLQQSFYESRNSDAASERSAQSKNSRSGITPSGTKYNARVYTEGSELSSMPPHQDHYPATVGGKGNDRFGDAEVQGNQQIRVNRDFSINHQVRQL